MLGTGEILLCPLACDQIHDLRLFPGEGPTCQDCKVPAGLVSPPTPPPRACRCPAVRRAAAEAAPGQKPGSASLRCPCVSILLLCDRHLADDPVLSTPPLQMGFSEGLPQGHQRLAASLELGFHFIGKSLLLYVEATPLRCKARLIKEEPWCHGSHSARRTCNNL